MRYAHCFDVSVRGRGAFKRDQKMLGTKTETDVQAFRRCDVCRCLDDAKAAMKQQVAKPLRTEHSKDGAKA